MKRAAVYVIIICAFVFFVKEDTVVSAQAAAPLAIPSLDAIGQALPPALGSSNSDIFCSFGANIDFLNKIFQIQMDFDERESLDVKIKFLSGNKFELSAKLDHIKLLQYDLSTALAGKGLIVTDLENKKKFIKGNLRSHYSLLNYKPLKEIKGNFKLDTSELELVNLIWGKMRINGTVAFGFPSAVDLDLEIIDMDINELAAILGIDQDAFLLSGSVDGRVKIKGETPDFYVRGQLWAYDGNIDDLDYSKIIMNLTGVYPAITIFDSGVIEKSGFTYALEGRVDLNELDNLASKKHNILFYPTDKDSFGMDAWSVRRTKDYHEEKEELEFQVSPGPNQPLKFRLKRDEEILGMEHTLRF
ncbi:hypothetical protein ACFL1E_06350 [Candidatus Omnitrophota bacterium]